MPVSGGGYTKVAECKVEDKWHLFDLCSIDENAYENIKSKKLVGITANARYDGTVCEFSEPHYFWKR